MKNKLQKNFYWGNSSAAMQIEGGWNLDGKGPSIYDIRESSEHVSDWKDGIDAYHRYAEDATHMQDLGMNMYRFSISWSRVNPKGDEVFNEAGIAYYHKVIDDLISKGIEPMICLFHFDLPLTLAENYNGFVSREVVDAYVRYAKRMVDEFSSKVTHWITFNEQNLYMKPDRAFIKSGYLTGEKTLTEIYQIMHNLMMSHVYVTNYIHETTKCKVTGMVAFLELYPNSAHPLDTKIVREWDEFVNFNILDGFVYGKYTSSVLKFIENNNIDMGVLPGDFEEMEKVFTDYITFSYYSSTALSHTLLPKDKVIAPNEYLQYAEIENTHLERTEWNWQIDPLGFRDIINKIYNRYKIPVFPIENGIGVIETWDGEHMVDDTYRINYHRDHIQAMKDAIFIDGADVMGYLGWGMIDFPSSLGDMRKRYGVVYVNRENHDLKDMKRVPKKSYQWLQKAFKSNGEDLE